MSELSRQWVQAMRRGRYDLAWAISEQALAKRDPARANDRSVLRHLRWVWDGRSFDGRDVLVYCYHGLGDTIQFARYLPRLARRAASVTLAAQPSLGCLLAEGLGVDRLIDLDHGKPPTIGCEMEITELAFALRETPQQLPPPYLRARPAALGRGVIGICHAAGDWDRERSMPAELFRPLCQRHPCLSLVCERSDLPVLNPEGCPFDMAATASLIAAVDLVVTVDTMVGHLAGAMGRPTWLLLKAEPDWRWAPDSSESVWYPSIRIYAQPEPGDWRSVVAQVERDLDGWR